MFDKHYNSHEDHHHHSSPSRIDVHEHRAVTDESIRIYDEIKEKAEKNILDTIYVKDNVINGVVVFYVNDVSCNYHRVHFKFTLNGKEFTGKISVDRDDIRQNYLERRKHAIRILLKEICIEVTTQMAKQIEEIVDEPISGILR